MFIRLLFLLLLALNLGAAAWLLFGRAATAPLPPPTDPGVPALRLVAAKPLEKPSAKRAPLPAPATATTLPQRMRDACHTLGRFDTMVDMRAAMQALSPHVARIQYREAQVNRSHGYWVYLPAAASREAALDEARQLSAKGIHDYYVVTAGDTQNTISLGLYNDQLNAQNRLVAMQKLGVPAKLAQRVDTEPAYWVDYAVPAGTVFTWTQWLPGRSDLQSKPIDCF